MSSLDTTTIQLVLKVLKISLATHSTLSELLSTITDQEARTKFLQKMEETSQLITEAIKAIDEAIND